MAKWRCLKCRYEWEHEGEREPRFCPLCHAQTIVKVKVSAG